MKIADLGETLRIFPDSLKVYDKIPVGTYRVEFSPMAGYYLSKQKDFDTPAKVYGKHNDYADLMMSRYQKAERNFGTILGGRKGTGKSMLARIMSLRLLEQGIPTVIVSKNTENLTNFLSEIEQPIFVLFDEFEKVFKYSRYSGDKQDEQTQFLSLFDGFHANKHFYLITVNDYSKLSEYFIGRTGRFYYNFDFQDLSLEEIQEFLQDTLEDTSKLKRLVSLMLRLQVNYDQLQSIVRELNMGETIENILKYLNLGLNENQPSVKYKVTYKFNNGTTYTTEERIESFADKLILSVNDYSNKNGKEHQYDYNFKIQFDYDDFHYTENGIKVDIDNLSVIYDNNDNKGGQLDNDNDVIYGEIDDIESIEIVRVNNHRKLRLDY